MGDRQVHVVHVDVPTHLLIIATRRNNSNLEKYTGRRSQYARLQFVLFFTGTYYNAIWRRPVNVQHINYSRWVATAADI